MIELPELRLDVEAPTSALDGVEPDRRAVIPNQELHKIQSKNADAHVARLTHMNSELHARVLELEEAIRGPGEFATWQAAAVDERLRRVKAEGEVADLNLRIFELAGVQDELTEANLRIKALEHQLATTRMLFDVISVAVDSHRNLVNE